MTDRKIKKSYQPSHYGKVPNVDWNAPEAQQLKAQKEVLHVTRTNLAIAHEAFDLAWRQYEYLEQQVTPHPFESPLPVNIAQTSGNHLAEVAKTAHVPMHCKLCFKRRHDPRHGAIKKHTFLPCGHSLAKTVCFDCGLVKSAEVHG